jgi:S-formylglutathione hydrolase FrmB
MPSVPVRARQHGRHRRKRDRGPLGRWIAVALALCAVMLQTVVSGDTGVAEAAPPAVTADDGARILSETWIDDRTVDLNIDSPALGTTGMVRVLVPTRWRTDTTRTWPSLYLLHGCCEPKDYTSWTSFTDVEQFTANQDVMVIMPTDGTAGTYSKWWNFGLSSKPDWETFHVTEVRQLVERGYRAGTVRAIAGLSSGGFGAMSYAFRHPGMFRAAAAYSGMLDTLLAPTPAIVQLILSREGFNPLALWGDPIFHRSLWSERNPADHVTALRGTRLYVSSGNGVPGPLDTTSDVDVFEAPALLATMSFTSKVQAAGMPITADFYGPGTHTWPYWQRALHNSWPTTLAPALGLPS